MLNGSWPWAPSTLSPLGLPGGWPLWLPSLPGGCMPTIPPTDSKLTCAPLRLETVYSCSRRWTKTSPPPHSNVSFLPTQGQIKIPHGWLKWASLTCPTNIKPPLRWRGVGHRTRCHLLTMSHQQAPTSSPPRVGVRHHSPTSGAYY